MNKIFLSLVFVSVMVAIAVGVSYSRSSLMAAASGAGYGYQNQQPLKICEKERVDFITKKKIAEEKIKKQKDIEKSVGLSTSVVDQAKAEVALKEAVKAEKDAKSSQEKYRACLKKVITKTGNLQDTVGQIDKATAQDPKSKAIWDGIKAELGL